MQQNLTIFENAIDSLVESVAFYIRSKKEPQKLRISIILLDNFLELFFKFYIQRVHPILIFENSSNNRSKTVSLPQSICLIKKLNYSLSNEFDQIIKILRYKRNKLQHHPSNLTTEKWNDIVGQIFYYVIDFDTNNGDHFDIQSHIPPDTWKGVLNLKSIFEKHREKAQEAAKESSVHNDNGSNQPECPECGLGNVSHIESSNRAFCHFCKDFFDIQQCCRCGAVEDMYKFSENDYGHKVDICNACFEDTCNQV